GLAERDRCACPEAARDIAGQAGAGADGIAAVAVDAAPGEAIGRCGAGLSVLLFARAIAIAGQGRARAHRVVAPGRDIRAGPERARDVASLARERARGVAAIAVDAQAVEAIGARPARLADGALAKAGAVALSRGRAERGVRHAPGDVRAGADA